MEVDRMILKMEYPAEIIRVGNSKGVIVPLIVVNHLGLETGDLVKVSVEKVRKQEEE